MVAHPGQYAPMTLRRHASSYAVIGIVQWLVEYGLMLVLSQWVMPVEPAIPKPPTSQKSSPKVAVNSL